MKRPPLHPPDETLVEAARAGDPGAFEQLVQRHFTMVYALAYARCGSRETAEDLAQEVFLRAFLHLGKLQQPRYFGTWLGRITRNLAADWQKSSQRASTLLPTVSLPASDSSIKDTTVSEIREQLDDQTRERLVQEAIAKLPIEQREMVMLHYAEGWSYKEIAERLEKDPTTVSRNLRRALDQIRSLVGESAVSIRPSPRGASRTVAVIGAVGLMSVEAKAALAASTEGAVAAVSTTSFGSSSSSALASFLASLNMPAPVTAVVTAVAGTKGLLIGAASVVAVAGGATYIATTTPPAAPNAVTVAAPAAGPALGGAKYDVDAPGLEGPWLGEGDLPRIGHQRGVFMITRDANGAYAGIFYNADEASGILQLTTISAEGTDIRFGGKVLGFKGTRISSSRIEGVLNERTTTTKMILNRQSYQPPPPVPPQRTAISLPVETLQKYVGIYARTSRGGIRMELRDGHLVMIYPEEDDRHFYPETETRFFCKTEDLLMEFARDPSGKVVSLTMIRPKPNLREAYRRMPDGTVLQALPTRIPGVQKEVKP